MLLRLSLLLRPRPRPHLSLLPVLLTLQLSALQLFSLQLSALRLFPLLPLLSQRRRRRRPARGRTVRKSNRRGNGPLRADEMEMEVLPAGTTHALRSCRFGRLAAYSRCPLGR